MKRIVIIEGTTIGAKAVNPKEILDVDDDTARVLISQKQAAIYVEPQPADGDQTKPTKSKKSNKE